MRGQLAWTPTDKTDFLLSVHAGYDKSEPTGLYLFNPLGYNATDPTLEELDGNDEDPASSREAAGAAG